jgi:hypothetical protein
MRVVGIGGSTLRLANADLSAVDGDEGPSGVAFMDDDCFW